MLSEVKWDDVGWVSQGFISASSRERSDAVLLICDVDVVDVIWEDSSFRYHGVSGRTGSVQVSGDSMYCISLIAQPQGNKSMSMSACSRSWPFLNYSSSPWAMSIQGQALIRLWRLISNSFQFSWMRRRKSELNYSTLPEHKIHMQRRGPGFWSEN
jgi:hypothetical protein